MKFGIRTKLFLVSLGLVALAVIAADIYLTTALDRFLSGSVREDLFVRIDLIEREVSSTGAPLDDLESWDALADDLGRRAVGRVTIIRKDGTVIGDSDLDLPGLRQVENHAKRPEFVQALAEGGGTSTRYSSTLRQRMMYVARPFHRQGAVAGVARIAMPLVEVDRAIAKLRGILATASILAILVAIALSSAAAHWTSRSVRALTQAAHRMAEGDLDVRTRMAAGDEIGALGKALDHLAGSLSATLANLRAERDLLGGILTGMQEGVLLVDPDGRVALVNPALREMLLLGTEVVGRSLLEVVRHAELKNLLDRTRASSTGDSAEIETPGIRPRRVLVRTTPLVGDPGGVLAVFFDVTDIRRLESLRRDFVANVSHELRTPITSLRSAAETMRGALADNPREAAQFLDMIERNTERLHRLVEDLLELSRIEARGFRLDVETLAVAPIVSHVLAIFGDRAEKKGIRLDSALPLETPLVLADRRAVEQILTNLVANAIQYCPGGSEVVVRGSADETLVRISVADNGPGIEARHLPRLFERFYRVDAGRSREMGGTGLGLSIVKHLVEVSGGSVDVESAVGKGSTFTFSLPRSRA